MVQPPNETTHGVFHAKISSDLLAENTNASQEQRSASISTKEMAGAAVEKRESLYKKFSCNLPLNVSKRPIYR